MVLNLNFTHAREGKGRKGKKREEKGRKGKKREEKGREGKGSNYMFPYPDFCLRLTCAYLVLQTK